MSISAEHHRLEASRQRDANWQRWGPYLSERQWGTVREDYSENQDAWSYFPHDHARSRAYRWGEDGLLGICDRQCRLCFAFAFWNGKDPILKERLFGLTGPEGNHGEDVKECYYYLDSTPTHSYMKSLYKYPHAAFPYDELVKVNKHRSRQEREFELEDTGVFDNESYFDCQIEYAKNSADDILIRATITNRGTQAATLHVLPQWWYRNTWTWECTHEGCTPKPNIRLHQGQLEGRHSTLGHWQFAVDQSSDGQSPSYLFTDNETNTNRHPDIASTSGYFKDAFHEYVVHERRDAVNPQQFGTKVASHSVHELQAGESLVIRARMCQASQSPSEWFGESFETIFDRRQAEADEFYRHVLPDTLDVEQTRVSRQAYAGLLWTKQFYHYVVHAWLKGDANYQVNTEQRRFGRNSDWQHLFNRDVISMPDKWEYPWYAAWDLAFHMLPMADVDLEFSKQQLILFLREWYMHPNGAIPAYEWALSDVNPPVHAWACWNVYLLGQQQGHSDKEFLARTFQKLLLNFTWWVNRKDPDGRHVFSGGFLGLDNIGVFDRSKPLPTGGYLHQADATAWMAFFCGIMLDIALELATDSPAYADMASKFLEHYIAIADAINGMHGTGLWDEEDGFYYDHISGNGAPIPLRVRSLVGLIPLCAPVVLDESKLAQLPGFAKRTEWFLTNRQDLMQQMSYMTRVCPDNQQFGRRLLALPSEHKLKRLLSVMLDESEFLSPYGIRSLSAKHAAEPFVFESHGARETVSYVPGESDTWMFGGNSNWRGPIWFPINYLLIESLREYHRFFGQGFQVECPTGSGNMMSLAQVADELELRLARLFLPDAQDRRPCHGEQQRYAEHPNWRDLILFYEYFHGDNGRGLGASHQTGWTALVATMLQDRCRNQYAAEPDPCGP
ncbi:MAG: glucosidase [bacterium]|nr:glucosidase [bacterium]